jgi:hypothetical protein
MTCQVVEACRASRQSHALVSDRTDFGSFASSVNKFILHTTEGGKASCQLSGATSVLDNEAYWPHFMCARVVSHRVVIVACHSVGRDCGGTVRIQQFIPTTVPGRALQHPGNTLGALQVEICGFAAQVREWPRVMCER